MVLVILYSVRRPIGTAGKEITTRSPIYYRSGFSYALRAAQDAQQISAISLSWIAGSAAQIGLEPPKQRDAKLYRATPNSTTQHKNALKQLYFDLYGVLRGRLYKLPHTVQTRLKSPFSASQRHSVFTRDRTTQDAPKRTKAAQEDPTRPKSQSRGRVAQSLKSIVAAESQSR